MPMFLKRWRDNLRFQRDIGPRSNPYAIFQESHAHDPFAAPRPSISDPSFTRYDSSSHSPSASLPPHTLRKPSSRFNAISNSTIDNVLSKSRGLCLIRRDNKNHHGLESKEFAGIMGMDEGQDRDTAAQDPENVMPNDDPLDSLLTSRSAPTRGIKPGTLAGPVAHAEDAGSISTTRGITLPIIRARPEYSTIYRKNRDEEQSSRQNVVCVVTVELPGRRRMFELEEDETLWQQKLTHVRPGLYSEDERDDMDDDNKEPTQESAEASHPDGSTQQLDDRSVLDESTLNEQARNGSSSDGEEEAFSFGATPAQQDSDGSFADTIADLRKRILDWKGHSVERFGKLQMHDFLGVRQDNIVREFYVYLFEEALLCVTEERKRERAITKLINAGANSGDDVSMPASSGSTRSIKAGLKLKGRIWLRHIRRCDAVEQDGSPCLIIKLDDEGLDHFILCFQDAILREQWQLKLTGLLEQRDSAKKEKEKDKDRAKDKSTDIAPMPMTPVGEKVKHGSKTPLSPKIDNGSHSRRTTVTSVLSGKSDAMTTPSSTHSSGRHVHTMSGAKAKEAQHKFVSGLPQHQQWSASGGLDPVAPIPDLMSHTPVDIVVMVSVPSVASQPAVSSATLSSSAALKLRLIRSTLDFVISHMGPRDRIALVAYNVGLEGLVRRTALLNSAKEKSRDKLEQFVETIGKPWTGPGEDPFLEDIDRLAGNSDRTDTVTAVNVGFDIVLQRKSKNPITSMILINDTADAPKRGQMDLVMARAEAANVPVHCFGFGKSHDPSSLWLISNHTRGSYTFVKEWYQLRECVAGCIGSILSVASTDVKVHISVPSDNHFRVRKVAGPSGAIVSASGKDVDIELGELRFGERKELFVELELDFAGLLVQHSLAHRRKPVHQHYEKGSATDDFMQRLGLQGLSIADDASHNGVDNADTSGPTEFVDEVAVLEVQCSCRDPAVGIVTSRLPDPCVMTVEIDSASQDPAAEAGGVSGLATALADPCVTRRRLEILVSDMITRSLLLVSRRNHHQALTILIETRKIVDTVLQAIPIRTIGEHTLGNLGRRNGLADNASQLSLLGTSARGGSHVKRQRDLLHRKTALSLLAILDDLDVLIDGLESGKSASFERTERNFGAQQAMILRDQKAWTSRTDTEWQFFRPIDNGAPFAALAAAFAAYKSR